MRPRPRLRRIRSTERSRSRSDSIFYVGSIAKQFVAACVALLDRDGAIDLGDSVSRYVPDLPPWGDRVTIRQLVHHTGGVKERERTGPGVPVDGVPAWGNADLLDALREVPELDFEPGTRYGYSNRGYLLLAEVVAAASGASPHRPRPRAHLRAARDGRHVLPRGPTRRCPTERPAWPFRGRRRRRLRGAGAVPRGGCRRPLDDRRRSRDGGTPTSTTTGSPTGGFPSDSPPAAHSTTARRSTTRGGCRCARTAGCRS